MRKYIWFLVLMSGLLYACTDEASTNEDEIYGNVERIDVEYEFDNVTYKYTDKITGEVDEIAGVGHYAEFTSVAGSSANVGKLFTCTFEGNEVLGKKIWGWLDVNFNKISNTLNVELDQTRSYNSIILGEVTEKFDFDANGIGLVNRYTDPDTGKEISEYRASGSNACDKTVNLQYEEVNSQYANKLFIKGCKNSAYIKVKAYHK